jgi:hypothetical protein
MSTRILNHTQTPPIPIPTRILILVHPQEGQIAVPTILILLFQVSQLPPIMCIQDIRQNRHRYRKLGILLLDLVLARVLGLVRVLEDL